MIELVQNACAAGVMLCLFILAMVMLVIAWESGFFGRGGFPGGYRSAGAGTYNDFNAKDMFMSNNPLRPYGCGPRYFVLALALCALAFTAGCGATKKAVQPPERYQPHQQFGKDGQPCMDGNCPVINNPKEWLKPCR